MDNRAQTHGNGPPRVRLKVWGPWACFTRPEMKVERVSYSVMTPSAARGVLEAIMWKPEMRWVVTQIAVLNPIQFQAVRRNEVQSKIAPGAVRKWMKDPRDFVPYFAGAGSDDATPRASLCLREVAYVIEAYPHVKQPSAENHPTKYIAMFNRRVEKGQYYHHPYFGCREFVADFGAPSDEERPIADSIDLGLMLYDISFGPDGNRAQFFAARLENGILDCNPETVLSDPKRRQEVLGC